jgi:DNA helicase-2/ATP-dependent DNA helicase PcrA
MKFIADLHIHSRFSRATSKDLNPENLNIWARKKGIALIGTGDFTHPGWIQELKERLDEKENGLYGLKPELEESILKEFPASCTSQTKFILSGEISCIYKKGGRTRKLHHLILMPDFESVARLNKELDRVGNILSDGRPILGLDSKVLLEMVLEASERAFFIPAHVWTPWFSLFGSKSGFDDIEECFEDLTPHIYALETGLSSDPPMNRLLSSLDNFLLVSNSDAHSPSKLGREANIFNTEMDYDHITQSMKTKKGFEGTIEFYPEEGKYHLDGHRKCDLRLHPDETRKHNGICPVCGKKLTVGVLSRISELSDRKKPVLSKEYYSLIPLVEILSEILGTGPNTKTVSKVYEKLLNALGPELKILMDTPIEDMAAIGGQLLSTAVSRMREGKVICREGYDGEYGTISLFHESEKHELMGQKRLFEAVQPKTVPSRSFNNIAKRSIDRPGKNRKKTYGSGNALDTLNPDQKKAVQHKKGHLLIVAGPGTGKTMTLTHRIAHLIKENIVRPDQILALTFTNKAAKEMIDRVLKLLPDNLNKEIKISTFHGFCLEILRSEWEILKLPRDFVLCSERDSSITADEVAISEGKSLQLAGRLKRELSRLKWLDVTNNEIEEKGLEIYSLYKGYKRRLREQGMLDLYDLETETLRLFQNFPNTGMKYTGRYSRIFIDEYQDTSPIQSAILNELVKDGINEICAIGDPDQAIYGFRGADIGNFHRFKKDFPGAKDIILSINYRSTVNILKAASGVMGGEMPLKGSAGKGAPVLITECASQSEEAEMVVEQIEKLLGGTGYFSLDSGRVASHEDGLNLGFGDISVLYRLNSQGNAFEESFSRAGIPYIRSGETPLINKYPADVIWRFLQAVQYPDNAYFKKRYIDLVEKYGLINGLDPEIFQGGKNPEKLFEKILSMHEFDISSPEAQYTVDRLRAMANNTMGDLRAFLDTLSLDRGIDHSILYGDRVTLMTVHAAKGLEWPVVFITGCEDRLFPLSIFGKYDGEEERRLFYVGMTRGKKQLFLSSARKRNINGRIIDMLPSSYLSSIPEDIRSTVQRSKRKPVRKKQTQLQLFSS